ncbi:MAG TPA: leucine-rich repeat domain-containing protein [Candidatus Borkfalkia excrementipullorum]|nr:leucine-rich repeat domain-containing protein [Candidatus Borkfalkia excrementipullorum]
MDDNRSPCVFLLHKSCKHQLARRLDHHRGGAFNSVSIASIVIPAGVTTIPDWAFSGCSSLTSVTIGSGVTSIGDFVSKTSTRLALKGDKKVI